MLLMLLTLLSMLAGGVLFVIMIGDDAWLIRGLRRDNFAASVVTCILLAIAIGLYIALRAVLPVVPEMLADAFASDVASSSESAAPGEGTPLLDAVKRIVYLCIPILVALILYGGYTGCEWLSRRLASGNLAVTSRVSNRL